MLLRATTLLTAVLAVALAWPAALGGATSYVVVSGVSMEPVYETGDLVVVRRSGDYEVGDVIAFRTQDGDVIHRIVDGDAATGFRTQGDNVERVDPYVPRPIDIRGRAVLHVPNVGAWGLRLVRTVPAPVLGAAALLLSLGGARRRRRRRVLRSRPPSEPVAPRPREVTVDSSPFLRSRVQQAAVLGVLAVVVLPSAFVAWRTPTQVPVDADVAPERHELNATVIGIASRATTLYPERRSAPIVADPSDEAGAPDSAAQPLLRSLVDRVEVTFAYEATGVEDGSGTVAVAAALHTGRGFVLPADGIAATPFEGSWTGTMTVDLDEVDRQLAAYLAEAGLDRDTVDVELTPTVVTTEGLVLTGDAVVLRPDSEAIAVDGSLRTVATPSGVTPVTAATGALVGLPLPVGVIRVLAPALVLGLLAGAAVLLRREEQDEPHLRIGLLYGSLLVEVDTDASVGGDIVRVASMPELARLARRDHRSILHQPRDDGSHRYLVPDGDLTYEFVVGAPARPDALEIPDDASGLDDLPAAPADLGPGRPVVVEDFAELSRMWLRGSDAPGRLERRRLADGGVRYAVIRGGREFVYLATPDEDVVRDGHWRG